MKVLDNGRVIGRNQKEFEYPRQHSTDLRVVHVQVQLESTVFADASVALCDGLIERRPQD